MSPLEKRLHDLERAMEILGEEAMTVSELDGFLAGLLVCPSSIEPHLWLPWIWGAGETGAEPPCSDDDFEIADAAIAAHYKAGAATLAKDPDDYQPVFELDPETDRIVWEDWVGGFEQALGLSEEAWLPVFEDQDGDGAMALTLMAAYMAIAAGTPEDMELTPQEVATMTDEAPEVIPGIVKTLETWRRANRPDAAPAN